MLAAVLAHVGAADVFIAVAAVADYTPATRRRAEDQEDATRR